MMIQFDEFCRLCARKKRNKFNLFAGSNDDNGNILLAKIAICLSLQVSKEDILPKMVCFDCQKSVESFNLFRIKCHKAEERLLKMLTANIPNKPMPTDIKQEFFESDFQENSNFNLEPNSEAFHEPSPIHSIKTLKNVKIEVDEASEIYSNCENAVTSDLIEILSKEVANQQTFDDVKQPRIEVISQNFLDKNKTIDVFEIENNEKCEVKVIPEIFLRQDIQERVSENTTLYENEVPVNFVENKEPVTLIDENLIEIEEKYLTLAEDETFNIDMEEIEADIKKKQDPKAKFHCDRCEKSFKFFKSLRKHRQWHDSQPEIFVCDICKKNNISAFEFSSLKSLNSHLCRKHSPLSENKFECKICHKILFSKGQYNAHVKRVHSKAEASCQICGKKFKNMVRLNCHLIVHREDRPFVCDQCGQTFKWSSALKVHIQWHRQEKNYLCSECGKEFTAKKNLIEHLNIHAGKRPFICEHCNSTFTQLSAYSKHLYLHNEGRNIHKCDKCQKKYSHAYSLKQHLLRHTNLRPYKCSICHCTFKSQSNLWCHNKIHQEKQYGCQVCGRKFALSKTLRDHMVLHTGIKHHCPAPGCRKTYTQRFSLTKHFIKKHPSLTIIGRKGGRKTHLNEKFCARNDSAGFDFIRYDFKRKDFA